MSSQESTLSRDLETAESGATLRLLLFEDNEADARLAKRHLDECGVEFRLERVTRLDTGVERLGQGGIDLVLLDLSLADSRGTATLEAVCAAAPVPVIVLAGSSDEQLAIDALQAGAQDYLIKDHLDGRKLRRSIRYAIERARMLRRVEDHAASLEQSEALFRRIFEINADSMLILGREGEIRLVNAAAQQLLDQSADQLIGETFPFLVRAHEQAEVELRGADDAVRTAEVRAVDLVWEGEQAKLMVLRDVTTRKSAELRLAAEKRRLAATLDSIADAVIAVDAGNRVELLNQMASKLTGWSEADAAGQLLGEVVQLQDPLTGKPIADPVDALIDDRGRPSAAYEQGMYLTASDGSKRSVSARMTCILDDDGSRLGCVLVLTDITRMKEIDEELFRAEKLNSISLLAGGIAHDFNNILTAVLGNLSVARLSIDADAECLPRLDAAENAALQAQSLTQQLLTFSKGGAPVLETATIDQLVEDSARFILRGSNVRAEVVRDPELWPVEVDKGQLSQVVNNLVINADQAMPKGGLIQLRMRNVRLNSNEVPQLIEGDYVCIAVEDAGCGIPPEVMKRIFDPYFTTKEDGNGLGLASCYSIIERHGGAIAVDSVVGTGTKFSVFLPRSNRRVEAPVAGPEADDRIYPGKGRILVMDDMEDMMTVAGEMLQALGYEVVFSRDGAEAIELYKEARESGAPFDAVVFDLTVPGGMGGEEACKILREYDPDLVAVASSGYTFSPAMSDFKQAGFSAVVPKPYRIKDMSLALHRLLA